MIIYTRTCIYSVCVMTTHTYFLAGRRPGRRGSALGVLGLISSAVFWRMLDGKWLKVVDYPYIIHIWSINVYWDDGWTGWTHIFFQDGWNHQPGWWFCYQNLSQNGRSFMRLACCSPKNTQINQSERGTIRVGHVSQYNLDPGEPVPGSVTSWRWFLQGNEQCTFQVMDISACFVGFSLVWMICHGHNLPRGSNWGPTKADSWLSLKVNARFVVTFRGLPGKELPVTGILHRMTMFFAKWSSLVSQKSLEPP
jgi:hypothetical protein